MEDADGVPSFFERSDNLFSGVSVAVVMTPDGRKPVEDHLDFHKRPFGRNVTDLRMNSVERGRVVSEPRLERREAALA